MQMGKKVCFLLMGTLLCTSTYAMSHTKEGALFTKRFEAWYQYKALEQITVSETEVMAQNEQVFGQKTNELEDRVGQINEENDKMKERLLLNANESFNEWLQYYQGELQLVYEKACVYMEQRKAEEHELQSSFIEEPKELPEEMPDVPNGEEQGEQEQKPQEPSLEELPEESTSNETLPEVEVPEQTEEKEETEVPEQTEEKEETEVPEKTEETDRGMNESEEMDEDQETVDPVGPVDNETMDSSINDQGASSPYQSEQETKDMANI